MALGLGGRNVAFSVVLHGSDPRDPSNRQSGSESGCMVVRRRYASSCVWRDFPALEKTGAMRLCGIHKLISGFSDLLSTIASDRVRTRSTRHDDRRNHP